MGIKWYLIVVSLTSNHVEHLFMHLSLEKCLIKPFAYFWIGLFVVLLSCRSSLYILDSNPLSDIWFANIFFHLVGCLFTYLCPKRVFGIDFFPHIFLPHRRSFVHVITNPAFYYILLECLVTIQNVQTILQNILQIKNILKESPEVDGSWFMMY